MNWKPALEADARLAAKNALKIRAAIAQSFDSKRVLLQYQQTQPIVTKNPTQDRARARSWAVMNINPNMQPLKEVMLRVWAEGYVTGEAFADEQIKFAKEISKADGDEFVDWKNWRPGDKATALLLRQPNGFKKLLDSQSITFKDFSNKTLFDIGDALAGAVELGLSPQRAAKQIQQHVANPARALSIAITEQNRAMSYATVNRFQDAGLEKMEWEVSSPCAVCAQNANQVVTIGQPFKSGVTQPPQHPHCRCVLLPVIPDYAEEGAMPGAVVVTPPPAPVVPAERVIAPGSDVFVPGAWTILSKEEIREGIIDRYVAALPQKTRDEIAVYVDDLRIAAPDKALMKSGVVYKNGPIQVNFYSTGAKLPEKNKQKVIDTIEKLQVMNPKKKVTINIGQESSSKYGWALLGGERLWITPKTARGIIPDPSEVGFKMPVLGQVSRLEYTLAHEWGHLIDEGGGFAKSGVSFQSQKTTDIINEAKRQFPDAFVSKYSLENSKEFYAEMFTEFFNSRGLTDNPLVQYMAKELGWKAPGLRAKTPAPKVAPTKAVAFPTNAPKAKTLKAWDKNEIIELSKIKDSVAQPTQIWNGPEKQYITAYRQVGDPRLKAILEAQGFTKTPTVVSATEYKTLVEKGGIQVYRGVTETTDLTTAQMIEQFKTGDMFVGTGVIGNGVYSGTDLGYVIKYAGDKSENVIEMVLSPKAKFIDAKDAEEGAKALSGAFYDAAFGRKYANPELGKVVDEYIKTLGSIPGSGEAATVYRDKLRALGWLYHDPGAYAATHGYDGIKSIDEDGGVFVILNRGAVVVKE